MTLYISVECFKDNLKFETGGISIKVLLKKTCKHWYGEAFCKEAFGYNYGLCWSSVSFPSWENLQEGTYVLSSNITKLLDFWCDWLGNDYAAL